MVFDSVVGRVLMFGGVNEDGGASLLFNDLWEWDGDAGVWISRTPTPLPADWPKPRDFHSMHLIQRAGGRSCLAEEPRQAS